MEYETKQDSSWFSKLRESPRTVSALIIILVVAAAIYAFSGNNTEDIAEVTTPETPETTEAMEEPQGEVASEETVMTPAPVTQETLRETAQAMPAATQTGEGYTEKAEAGDGLTHLARRAATRWLAEHTAGYTVTNEHRIYIEDYIQKKLGSGRLEIGQEQPISFGLIEEAVKAAGELKPQQLNNLSKYTAALS